MRVVHLTKIAARLERVREQLVTSKQTAEWMQKAYDLPRLIEVDVPALIEAVRDAKAEAAAARRELLLAKEVRARYQVTVYSDSPMRVSRVEVERD